MDEDQLDLLFHALASQPRREMLDLLKSTSRVPTVGFRRRAFLALAHRRDEASRRDGGGAAARYLGEAAAASAGSYFNPVPLQWVYERWTDEYSRLLGGPPHRAETHHRNRRIQAMNESTRAVFRIVIDGSIETICRELTKTGRAAGRRLQRLAARAGADPGGADADAHRHAVSTCSSIGKVRRVRSAAPFRPHVPLHAVRRSRVHRHLRAETTAAGRRMHADRRPHGRSAARRPRTCRRGGTAILETLKAVVETGRPRAGGRG